jgi:tetratricopeptide (TPR) repeat protein
LRNLVAFFVAFYSYKGGVGRTLALSNIAYSLAERGKRVVLLDMDLEAPSLHDVPEFALKGAGKKGLIEYASSYRKTGKLPSIESYVHKCRRSPGSGELWLMPAGRMASDYQQQLGDLSWRRLHPKLGTKPFVDDLRQTLDEKIKPHYVLIDARTGLSDIGGLSTHLLADMVVLVFNLTPASIEGSVRAFRSFTSEGSRVRFVQLVASPVPSGESLAEKRIQQAAELMQEATLYGRNLIRIDYNPAMVLAENLAIRNPDIFPAAERYEAIRDSLQRANPAEVFPLVEQAHQFRSEGRLDEAVDLLRTFTASQPGDVEGHLALGNLLFEAGRYQEASEAFRSACDLAPDIALAHRRLGEALVSAERADEAIKALERATNLGDRSRELYLAQARAYGQKNETALEAEARSKAMLSILRQPESLKPLAPSMPGLRRDFVEVLKRRPPYGDFKPEEFWDEVMGSFSLPMESKLNILSQTLKGSLGPSELRALLQGFREEDKRWIEILGPSASALRRRVAGEAVDPTNEAALLKLRDGGPEESALLGLLASRSRSNQERVRLLTEAIEKDPTNHALLTNLATSLADLARESSDDHKLQLFLAACDRYREALSHKPSSYPTLLSLAITTGDLARLAEGAESQSLWSKAADLARKAREINPKGDADYNLACALSQLQKFEEASALLQLDLERRPLMIKVALEDPDFYPLWEIQPDLRKNIEEQLTRKSPPPEG